MMDKKRNKKTNNSSKNKKFTHKMQANLLLVFCVIAVVLMALCIRIAYIGMSDGERYKKKVLEQQSYVSSEIAYERGSIYDRKGQVLARNEKYYNVVLDPKVVLTYDMYLKPTKQALAQVFGYPEEMIQKILDENPTSQYYILEKLVSVSKVQAFENLQKNNTKIKGVWFEEEYVRSYPYGSLASRLIGFTASGNQGIWGVEQHYNEELNGTNGRIYGYYDEELNLQRTVREAVDGNSLRLTLDLNVQTIIERYATEFRKNVGCKNIGIIVMNPNNGEILGMTSNEEYDLNNPRDLSAWYTEEELAVMTEEEKYNALNQIWRNFCVSDTFEPGSTYKPFTIAAALEENMIRYDDKYDCTGYHEVGGWKISCANRYGHGLISLTESIMKSCNCALMDIVDIQGRSCYHRYQVNFGFGDMTGIDIPGESKGIIWEEDKLNVTELATASFGQSFNVSMIQMATAFSALVNGGNYYQPHVVASIIDSEGVTIKENEPVLVRKIVSEATSEFLREAFYQTVEGGTASKAKVSGYLIGGKTGTAQKLPRDAKKYVVSFIACAPVKAPEVVTYVVIDEPQDEEYSASSHYATTITADIMEEILPYLGCYPEGEIDYAVRFPQIPDPSQTDEENTDAVPVME